MADDAEFQPLLSFLKQVPAITAPIGFGYSTEDRWWVKFAIDIKGSFLTRTATVSCF